VAGRRRAACRPDGSDIGALAAWKADAERTEALLLRLEADRVRIDGETVRLEADRKATGDIAGVVTDLEATRIRSMREAAWAQHRRTLDAGSADTFENALRQDDMVTGARLGHAQDIARLHETGRQLAGLAAERAQLEARLAAAQDSRRVVANAVASAVGAMHPACHHRRRRRNSNSGWPGATRRLPSLPR